MKMSVILIFNPAPVVAFIRIHLHSKFNLQTLDHSFLSHLVFAGDVAPEDDALLLRVIVDAVWTQAGDAHTLPLLHPVLDSIQLHDRSALNMITMTLLGHII